MRLGRVAVIVPAAGRGDRLGPGPPKAFREVAGTALLVHALRSLLTAPSVDVLIVAGPADALGEVMELVPEGTVVVAGGNTRAESVRCALTRVPADVDVVLVHDAARPFVPAALVEAVVSAVRSGHAAVVPVVQLNDTVKQLTADGRVVRTLARDELFAAQTPQGFRRDLLVAAHQAAPLGPTDDAVLVESLGHPVWTLPGADEAFKVTRPLDLLLAESVLAARHG